MREVVTKRARSALRLVLILVGSGTVGAGLQALSAWDRDDLWWLEPFVLITWGVDLLCVLALVVDLAVLGRNAAAMRQFRTAYEATDQHLPIEVAAGLR